MLCAPRSFDILDRSARVFSTLSCEKSCSSTSIFETASLSGSLAVPLSRRVRGEVGVGAAWARDRRSGFTAEPLAGVSVGINAPGPWGSLLSASLAYPLVTPGNRGPVVELFVLRPLGGKK